MRAGNVGSVLVPCSMLAHKAGGSWVRLTKFLGSAYKSEGQAMPLQRIFNVAKKKSFTFANSLHHSITKTRLSPIKT